MLPARRLRRGCGSLIGGGAKGAACKITRSREELAQGDSATLVKQLQGLADDASLCERMGRNARAMFERRFDKPIAMRAWRELLLSL